MNRLITIALLCASMCPIVSAQLVTEIKRGAEFAFPEDWAQENGILVDDVVWSLNKRLDTWGTKTNIWYDRPKYSKYQKEYVIFSYSAGPGAIRVGDEDRKLPSFHPLRKKVIEDCRLAVAMEDFRSVDRNSQYFRIKKRVTLYRWNKYNDRFEPDKRVTWLMEPVPEKRAGKWLARHPAPLQSGQCGLAFQTVTQMHNLASNRQKKLLRFFRIRFSPIISQGAAGWEIGSLLEDDDLRERWRRYLYLTRDFDSDTDQLKPFDQTQLETLVIPDDWHSSDEIEKFKEELVANVLANNTPYDDPQPPIQFSNRTFAFTGNFNFGTRKDCQNAVVALGGAATGNPTINRNIDYLVIGTQGSPAYKRGSYGNKIEKAILARRECGSPSIVSEDHWIQEMEKHHDSTIA